MSLNGLYGYERALTAAGVKVLAYEQFGTYRGQWWAQVQFPNGKVYFVRGSYGDASETDMRWDDERELREIGGKRLSYCLTNEHAIAEASRNMDSDVDTETVIAWIKARR